MLSTSQADLYAYQFLEARAKAQALTPLSSQLGALEFSIADAYIVAHSLDQIRISEGETPVGRKLGFTNRNLWDQGPGKEAIHAPMWTTLFSSTVRCLEHPFTVQSLVGALQPKLEPEIVVKLAKAPAADASVEDIADCLEWMAHGLEIVVNPFNTPCNTAADAIAAFGMHGTLLIGEARMLSSASRQHLAEVLSNASVSVSCEETMMGAGFGHNVLNSPVHAIWHLHQLLKAQPAFPPLQAGEIITTGSWTPSFPVQAGQTWVTAFSGVNVPGLSISFV